MWSSTGHIHWDHWMEFGAVTRLIIVSGGVQSFNAFTDIKYKTGSGLNKFTFI